MAVYQSSRYTGDLNYNFTSNITAGTSYKMRFHFAEQAFNSAGARVFSIQINGITVCTNLDIYQSAGAQYKALVREYTVTAESYGLSIWMHASANNASVNGIEILTVGSTPSVQPPVITSMIPSGNKPELGWSSVAGQTYAVYKSTNLLAGWIASPLTNITGDGTAKIFADPSPSEPAAFYRITAR